VKQRVAGWNRDELHLHLRVSLLRLAMNLLTAKKSYDFSFESEYDKRKEDKKSTATNIISLSTTFKLLYSSSSRSPPIKHLKTEVADLNVTAFCKPIFVQSPQAAPFNVPHR
jgi:hypothetical protein